MGLASSQARLLNLTSRMHQIEYNAAKLEAQKLQMANESRQVYLEYQDALEKTKVQMKTLTNDGAVTYTDITSYDSFIKAGFALVYGGKVFDNSTVTIGVPSVTTNGGTVTTVTNSVPVTYNLSYLVKLIADETNPSNTDSDSLVSNEQAALTNVINSGFVTIVQKPAGDTSFPSPSDPNKFADYETSVAINTGLQEVTDESGLRKAEAKYEADMKRIDMKDRKYDYDLAALENERNAVKNEMETLKTVARDNVDRTFKLFS